jgi:membrane-bound inhibitor of C-type lysozyme
MRLLLPSACLALAVPAAGQTPTGFAATYVCAGGVVLQAAYLNPPGDPSFAVVMHDGDLVPMQAGPTGSGVRYVALDGSGLVWHTKGDDGFLAHDQGGGQETLLADCHVAAG